MTTIASRDHLEYIFARALFVHDPIESGCVFDEDWDYYADEATLMCDLYIDSDLDVLDCLQVVMIKKYGDKVDADRLFEASLDIIKDLEI